MSRSQLRVVCFDGYLNIESCQALPDTEVTSAVTKEVTAEGDHQTGLPSNASFPCQ